MNKIKLTGMYGDRTRRLQRTLSRQIFDLAFKEALVYRYLGSAENAEPSIDDIQIKVFNEVIDRAYDSDPVKINIGMEPVPESSMDFSRFGIINPMGNEQTIRIHIDEFEKCMGRWLIVGDVIEIPFLERNCKSALFEITDVDDKPSYEKFYITAQITPLNDTRETYQVDKDRSNYDFNIDIQEQQDAEFEEQVPYEGIGDEVDDQEPVDPRRDKQSSFLDDPDTEF